MRLFPISQLSPIKLFAWILTVLLFSAGTAAVSSAQTFTSLINLNGANGEQPQAALVQGKDGNFYGTTFNGGRSPMKNLAILMAMLTAAQITAAQTKLTGVYRAANEGSSASQGADSTGAYFYLTFFADGHVRRTHPEVGLEGFNPAYQMNLDIRSGIPKDVRKWGTYRVSGEQGRMEFANRDVWTFSLKGYPESIECQGRTYILLDSGRGLRLQGTYKSTKDDALITFADDGKMNQQGIVANCVSGGSSYSVGSGGIATSHSHASLCLDKPLAGGYSIGYYTLKLLFSGSSNAYVFWLEPSSNRGAPPAVYIDNVKYVLAR